MPKQKKNVIQRATNRFKTSHNLNNSPLQSRIKVVSPELRKP